MTCIVRKTLAELEVPVYKSTRTCRGKIVFDEASFQCTYAKLSHARFILNNDFSPYLLKRHYYQYLVPITLSVNEALKHELDATNKVIEKFNVLIPIYLSKLSKSHDINVSVARISTIEDINDANSTVSQVNSINLRSIIGYQLAIPKAVVVVSPDYQVVPSIESPKLSDIESALNIYCENLALAGQFEVDTAKNIEILYKINMYLSDCIKQLEGK